MLDTEESERSEVVPKWDRRWGRCATPAVFGDTLGLKQRDVRVFEIQRATVGPSGLPCPRRFLEEGEETRTDVRDRLHTKGSQSVPLSRLLSESNFQCDRTLSTATNPSRLFPL